MLPAVGCINLVLKASAAFLSCLRLKRYCGSSQKVELHHTNREIQSPQLVVKILFYCAWFKSDEHIATYVSQFRCNLDCYSLPTSDYLVYDLTSSVGVQKVSSSCSGEKANGHVVTSLFIVMFRHHINHCRGWEGGKVSSPEVKAALWPQKEISSLARGTP